MKGTLILTRRNAEELKIQEYDEGLYLIKVITENQQYIGKFVIKKYSQL